jgi:hypothetical protein
MHPSKAKKLSASRAGPRVCFEIRLAESAGVVFKNRSGANSMFVSTEAQKTTPADSASRLSKRPLRLSVAARGSGLHFRRCPQHN